MRAEIGDGLLRDIELALLLVVIKEPCRRIEILGIGVERGASLVEKLAQIFGFTQQIEITLDQFRIPERLKTLLVNREAFAHRSLAVLDHRFCLHREDAVVGKLLAVVGDEFSSGSILLLRHEELQKTRVQRLLLGIASDPGAVLGDGNIFRQALRLNDAEDALKRLPRPLLGGNGKFFSRDGWRGRDQRENLDFIRRTQAAMVKIGQGQLGADLVGRFLDVGFPVGLGRSRIELLFIFKSAQGIKLGVRWLSLDEVGKRRARLARRPAKKHSAAWQRHHAEEDGLQRAVGLDVPNPRGQFANGGNRPSDGGDERNCCQQARAPTR